MLSYRRARSTAIDVTSAIAAGRLALARVVHADSRGLHLLVVPRFGTAFEVRASTVTDAGIARGFAVDQVVVVVLAHAAPSPVVVIENPPRDWAEKARTDETVRLPRTAPLFEAAGVGGSPDDAGRRRRITLLGAVGLAAAVAIVVAGYLFLEDAVRPSPTAGGPVAIGSPSASETATPEPSPGASVAPSPTEAAPPSPTGVPVPSAVDPLTAAGAHAALIALTASCGPQVTSVSIGRDSVAVDVPSSPGATTLDRYEFVDGVVTRQGPSFVQLSAGDAIEDSLFDLSSIDPSLVERVLARAVEATQITGPTAPGSEDDPPPIDDGFEQPSIYISRFFGAAPTVLVSLHDSYADGSVIFDLAGGIVTMHGGRPGSESWLASSN